MRLSCERLGVDLDGHVWQHWHNSSRLATLRALDLHSGSVERPTVSAQPAVVHGRETVFRAQDMAEANIYNVVAHQNPETSRMF